jgi:fucose permease
LGPLLLSTLIGPSFLRRSSLGLDGTAGETQLRSGLVAMAGAGASF